MNIGVNAGVATFTIAKGTKNNTYAFKTEGGNYLYAASSSSNDLKEQASLDDNGSWSISINGGVASIVAQGDNTRNRIKYNNQQAENLLIQLMYM